MRERRQKRGKERGDVDAAGIIQAAAASAHPVNERQERKRILTPAVASIANAARWWKIRGLNRRGKVKEELHATRSTRGGKERERQWQQLLLKMIPISMRVKLYTRNPLHYYE